MPPNIYRMYKLITYVSNILGTLFDTSRIQISPTENLFY